MEAGDCGVEDCDIPFFCGVCGLCSSRVMFRGEREEGVRGEGVRQGQWLV